MCNFKCEDAALWDYCSHCPRHVYVSIDCFLVYEIFLFRFLNSSRSTSCYPNSQWGSENEVKHEWDKIGKTITRCFISSKSNSIYGKSKHKLKEISLYNRDKK